LTFTAAMTALLIAPSAQADPVSHSCQFAAVLGGNDVDAVNALMDDIGTYWAEDVRGKATDTIRNMLRQFQFSGANVYRLVKLGDDYESHFLALRIATGEIAAGRLNYEWGPDGLRLTEINFTRRMSKSLSAGTGGSGSFEPIDCP